MPKLWKLLAVLLISMFGCNNGFAMQFSQPEEIGFVGTAKGEYLYAMPQKILEHTIQYMTKIINIHMIKALLVLEMVMMHFMFIIMRSSMIQVKCVQEVMIYLTQSKFV